MQTLSVVNGTVFFVFCKLMKIVEKSKVTATIEE